MQQYEQVVVERDAVVVPDRIVVAANMEELERLLPFAMAQAKVSGATVTIVHAVSPMYAASLDAAVNPPKSEMGMLVQVRASLQQAVHGWIAEGIHVEIVVRIGMASDVIREELLRAHGSRLIMGTHGRGKFGQLALGSVAHALISKVNVPIFVVGPHAVIGTHLDAQQRHATPSLILHPVAFAGAYRENARLAMEIAAVYGAELTLLHVLEQDPETSVNPERTMHWAEMALRELVDSDSLHVQVRTKVAYGTVAAEVLRAAGEMNADWIVLSMGEESRRGFFKETRAFEVIAEAACPVLTLGR